jgi:secreted Zn-dependent insulinase-like peptidase
MLEKVAEISDEDFETLRGSFMTELTQKDLNMSEENATWWNEI